MPEQRAFSPDAVATMLGIDRATVSSLLTNGALGCKEIGDVQRIFLSDLEDYLGTERAHSLVRAINRDDRDAGIGTFQSSTPEGSTRDSAEISGAAYEMELPDGGDPGRTRPYESVVQTWREIDKDEEAIVLADLSENDVQNIKALLHRRVGKENVIVRTAQQEDGTFKAVVRAREDNEYLRE